MSSGRAAVEGARHAPGPDGMGADSHGEHDSEINVRPMRLKVLYTFDEQSRTNCLARWPHILDVQTVAIDERTSIGVIDLKTCIQAIVQCSPELVANLGQDYTVYAFDFSEDDTPLVGQGMLSWALTVGTPAGNTSSDPSQSRQLITGRVCKNILGIFSSGVKETLEVKLRLVPVPTVQQSEFLNSLDRYRELSKVLPSNFDPKEWTSFLESNPDVTKLGQRPTPSTSLNQRNGASLEVVNQLLSPSLQPHDSPDPFITNDMRQTGSRPGTPADNVPIAPSRPSSRASQKRGRKPRAKSTGNGDTSGYEEGTDGEDQPVIRKRAKIMQTDWKSKSSFGSGSSDLRVTASTAGSLRMFRPIAPAQPGPSASHLSDAPRAPTPVPFQQNQPNASQDNVRRASLFQATTARRYRSPYLARDATEEASESVRLSIESAMTSPERAGSPGDTPPDIGSSPPVVRTINSTASSPGAAPSSPILPEMPRIDSGFFSGAIDDCSINELFEENDSIRLDDEMTLPRQRPEVGTPMDRPEDVNTPTGNENDGTTRRSTLPPQYNPGDIIEVNPGPPELLPKTILPRNVPPPRKMSVKPSFSKQGSTLKNSNTTDDAQTLPAPVRSESTPQPIPPPTRSKKARTASVSTTCFPAIPASEPALPPPGFHRSHTWSDAPHPQTDAPDTTATGFTRTTAGKKQAIRQKLENAIARGEMPPFCSNCGAIETPTWRKAWAREVRGEPGYHEYSDEPGKVTAIDILERDDNGKPLLYRIIKKSLLQSENKEEFAQFLLCNPCGIWMSKYNRRRPEDKWDKEPGITCEPKKRGRSQKSKNNQARQSGAINPTSEVYLPSDALAPPAVESPPEETSQMPAALPTENESESLQTAAPVRKQRSSSLRPTMAAENARQGLTVASLHREVQSSPVRWPGSQDSPIELDEDLGSTRRLLFPSPRKTGEVKVLGPVTANSPIPATEFRSPKTAVIGTASLNKENCEPTDGDAMMDRDILELFEEEIARPSTPTGQTPSANPFKTPTRAPSTPFHRPLTRSQSRSIRSSAQKILAMVQKTPSKTPSKTPGSAARIRRSPRNHPGSSISSPFTMALSSFLSPSRNQHHSTNGYLGDSLTDIDFSLPALDPSSMNIPFNFRGLMDDQDMFSTDVLTMPSSPPRCVFGGGFNDDATAHMWANMDMSAMTDMDLSDLFKTGTMDVLVQQPQQPQKKALEDSNSIDQNGQEATSQTS